MTKKLKFTLIALLLALLSFCMASTVYAKYVKEITLNQTPFSVTVNSSAKAYAVATTDNCLYFFKRSDVPIEGGNIVVDESTGATKQVHKVYEDIETKSYGIDWQNPLNSEVPEWSESSFFGYLGGTMIYQDYNKVEIVDEGIKPKSMMCWFFGFAFVNNGKFVGLDKIDTSCVEDMTGLFGFCGNVTELDLGKFDTSSVKSMYGMFLYCYGLLTLDISNFDTSNVINMNSLFFGCRALTSIVFESNTFNTSKVEDMGYMFKECNSLTTLDVSSFDTSNVKDMQEMFLNNKELQTLDLSNFDTRNVTNMDRMFQGCNKLETIYASDKFDVTNVTSSINMFAEVTEIVGGNKTVFDTNKINKDYARIDGLNGEPGYFTYKGYMLIFDALEGTGAPNIMFSETNAFIIPSDVPVNNHGRNFVGWSTSKNVYIEEYRAGDTFTIAGTAVKDTLYAVYDDTATTKTGVENILYAQWNSSLDNLSATISGGNWQDDSSNPVNDLAYSEYKYSIMTLTITANEIIINDGTFEGGILIDGDNTVAIINGGTFNVSNFIGNNTAISIYGGKWTADSITISGSGTHSVKIYGGEFKWNPTEYLAEGYTATQDSITGYWVVSAQHNYLYISDNNVTHTGTCTICNATITEEHTLVYGACSKFGCGYGMSELATGEMNDRGDGFVTCTAIDSNGNQYNYIASYQIDGADEYIQGESTFFIDGENTPESDGYAEELNEVWLTCNEARGLLQDFDVDASVKKVFSLAFYGDDETGIGLAMDSSGEITILLSADLGFEAGDKLYFYYTEDYNTEGEWDSAVEYNIQRHSSGNYILKFAPSSSVITIAIISG